MTAGFAPHLWRQLLGTTINIFAWRCGRHVLFAAGEGFLINATSYWHFRRDVFWSHLVSVWVGAHWVLSSQCNAACHDHKEDGHLKVAQSDHIVTNPPDTVEEWRGRLLFGEKMHTQWAKQAHPTAFQLIIGDSVHFAAILRVRGLEDEHAVRSYTFRRSWRFLVLCRLIVSLVRVICL